MKKRICLFLCLVLLLSALGSVAASATAPVHPVDRTLVYKAAFGTPVVDGIMDEIYLQSDAMYAENVAFGSSASVKDGANATAEYRIVWNQTTLFIFATVTDPTRSKAGATNASATKMDNTDIYVILDPLFSTENDYSDRTVEASGQFRYQPNCTIDEEPTRSTSWGKLTVRNQLSGTLNYVGGYLDDTTGSYSFEMCFNYNPTFLKTIAENVKTRTETAIGFSLQINDVMDDDAARDALVYSNNAKGGLSSNLNNCGKVVLFYQDGVEIPTEEESEQPTEPPTEESGEAPTETPTETPTEAPTAAPTEAQTETPTTPAATTAAPSGSTSGGCSSSVTSTLALLMIIGTGGSVCMAVRKKKH